MSGKKKSRAAREGRGGHKPWSEQPQESVYGTDVALKSLAGDGSASIPGWERAYKEIVYGYEVEEGSEVAPA